MSHDLAQANQLRTQMTADIAHDLRTPLSILQGYLEGLKEGELTGSPHLFDRLYRADKSRGRSEHEAGSSGLGLAIAKAIVVVHGGEISAESQPNRGTIITVKLLI